MNIIFHLCFDDSVRPCGCPRAGLSDLTHWWKYTKLRYWWRVLQATPSYCRTKLRAKFLSSFCRWASDAGPEMRLGLGIISVYQALDEQRRWQKNADDWKRSGHIELGADSARPDGIEAESPADLVCMTNDEWSHWFGSKS